MTALNNRMHETDKGWHSYGCKIGFLLLTLWSETAKTMEKPKYPVGIQTFEKMR